MFATDKRAGVYIEYTNLGLKVNQSLSLLVLS